MVITVGSRVCAFDSYYGGWYSGDVINITADGYTVYVQNYRNYGNINLLFSLAELIEGDCSVVFPPPPVCVPAWKCELPLNGYENDGCGNRRTNPACNPPPINQWYVNIYVTDSVLGTAITGATVTVGTQSQFTDGFGLARFLVNEGTITISISKTGYTTFSTTESVFAHRTFPYTLVSLCVSVWKCILPLSGFEADGCGNSRLNPACNPPPVYREAGLVSCSFPANALAGQTYQGTVTVNQGSVTENYKLVFSGGLVGESTPFIINTGTGQQIISSSMVFLTGGPKTTTISLVKI